MKSIKEVRVGAWGAGPFENDDALDFVGDLTDEPVEQLRAGIRAAMTQVLDTSDYVECPEMDAAIAAACLVAARIDPSLQLDANGRHYLDQMPFQPDDELRTLAAGVFTRAFQPENNEWYELWAESTGHPTENEAALAPFRAAANSR
ncbi:DUF4259 domain-containing protein [Actinomadura scrupuli]|uniref:DUF4259 domain-containing protein n=1 Tax=Actinomadura scrupuli TaxID=559629 RepID=UPI003D97A93F